MDSCDGPGGRRLTEGLSSGGANEAEVLLVAVERFTGPVFGDLREETMLDGVPFGSTRWVVGDGEGQAV